LAQFVPHILANNNQPLSAALCNKFEQGCNLKFYLKTFLTLTCIPLVVGIVIGALYQYASGDTQSDMEQGILGFSNQYVFEMFVFLNILLVAIYVFIKGQVNQPLSKLEKFLFYWLPATALGFVVPFFGAMYGFIIGHPSSPDLINLAILGIFAFIWSAGFFMLLLLPAHAGIYPKKIKDKRLLYSAITISMFAVYGWRFVT
jgi:hypothetical protein